MGRKKGSGEKKEKRSPVKLSAIPRKHAGKITEPWTILERLIGEMANANPMRFAHLENCKLKLWWTKDWKADPDGIVVGAQVGKASEVDRILVEESNGESPDIFIKLPKDQWPHLDDTEKEHRLFHELCHVRPALDGNGNQKRDTKERLLWRLGRHPIACFPEEIERFGTDRVIGHNSAIAASVETAARPMLAAFDAAEAKAKGGKEAWRSFPLSQLGLPPAVENYVDGAGMKTIGSLSSFQEKHGDFWDKDLTVGGERKPAGFRGKVDSAFADFWAEHPEFCA